MAIQQIIKHARLKHILATHKRARREWDRETKTWQIRWYLGLSVFQKLNYIQMEYFSKITTCYMFSRNSLMYSLQNAGVPVLKNPPWDPVISLQSAWDFQGPFLTKFLSFNPHVNAFFSTKCLACQSWSGPWTFSQGGLTTKWPIKTHL